MPAEEVEKDQDGRAACPISQAVQPEGNKTQLLDWQSYEKYRNAVKYQKYINDTTQCQIRQED